MKEIINLFDEANWIDAKEYPAGYLSAGAWNQSLLCNTLLHGRRTCETPGKTGYEL
jgi:hypothetical protein